MMKKEGVMKGIIEGLMVLIVGLSAAFIGLSILNIIDLIISFRVT